MKTRLLRYILPLLMLGSALAVVVYQAQTAEAPPPAWHGEGTMRGMHGTMTGMNGMMQGLQATPMLSLIHI